MTYLVLFFLPPLHILFLFLSLCQLYRLCISSIDLYLLGRLFLLSFLIFFLFLFWYLLWAIICWLFWFVLLGIRNIKSCVWDVHLLTFNFKWFLFWSFYYHFGFVCCIEFCKSVIFGIPWCVPYHFDAFNLSVFEKRIHNKRFITRWNYWASYHKRVWSIRIHRSLLRKPWNRISLRDYFPSQRRVIISSRINRRLITCRHLKSLLFDYRDNLCICCPRLTALETQWPFGKIL